MHWSDSVYQIQDPLVLFSALILSFLIIAPTHKWLIKPEKPNLLYKLLLAALLLVSPSLHMKLVLTITNLRNKRLSPSRHDYLIYDDLITKIAEFSVPIISIIIIAHFWIRYKKLKMKSVYEPNSGDLKYYLESPKNLFGLAFLPLFIIIWTYQGIGLIDEMINLFQSGKNSFLIYLLLILIGVWVWQKLLRHFLWCSYGKETLLISQKKIEIHRSLPGFHRKHELFIQNLSNISEYTLISQKFSLKSLIAKLKNENGKIIFDSKEATYNFGINLNEKEAKELIKKIEKFITINPADTVNRAADF